MRCSQCGHITDAERYTCQSCGQDLSPGSDRPPSALEFPKVSEPIGPLADLDLDQTHTTTTTAPSKQPLTEPIVKSSLNAALSSLPLFPGADAPVPTVAVSRARSTRPLAVRRPTPRVPKLRTENDRSNAVGLALEFETETEAEAVDRFDAPISRNSDGVFVAFVGRRVCAAVCDLLLLGAIDTTVVALTVRLAGLELVTVDALPLVPLAAFLLLLDFGYLVALTALGGQTIGKMVTGIRVVSVDGPSVTVVDAAIRAAAYIVSVLPVGLGMLGLFFGSRRSLHDYLADTRVVKV